MEGLKKVRAKKGHVSTKQRMKKKKNRKQRAQAMQALASTYVAKLPADAAGTARPSSGGAPAAKRRKPSADAAAAAAPPPASAPVLAAGQSNWQRLQKVLPPPRAASAGKRRRAPDPSAPAGKKPKAAKEPAEQRGGTNLVEEMGSDYAGSCVACDCEMVGVGPQGKRSMLARVALVDGAGGTLYDKYVLPMEKVTDYRTEVSGIRPRDIRKGGGALAFAQVQREVASLLQGRLLIGHAVHHDLKSMMLQHPRAQLRDTSLYPPLRSKDGRPRSLKHLAADVGLAIQSGERHRLPTD